MAPELTLRAHHLESTKLLHQIPRDLIVRVLIESEYIPNKNDAFVDFIYHTLKKGFGDLSRQVKLQVGGLDEICIACPKHQTGICTPESPHNNRIVGAVFLRDYESGEKDLKTIARYNLDPEKIYTIQELRKIMDF